MLISPLEQFDIIIFLFSSNIVIFIYIFIIIFFFFFSLNLIKLNLFYLSLFQYCLEFLFNFIREIIILQIGKDGLVYFPIIYSLFFFILCLNLFGMLPFGFTLTAHISLTFFFAFSFNFGFILLGIYKFGFNFLKLFLPSGTPKFLIGFIFCIELMSYLIRTFSLSIRLFANMMAGHCLLYVFSLFVFNFFNMYFYFSIIFVCIIYLLLYLLEICICFLQAYVFIILICIYINDSLHIHH